MASATQLGGIGLAHGSMRDPAWEYVVEPAVARALLEEQVQQVVLVGHSHLALSWRLDQEVVGGAAGSCAATATSSTGASAPGSSTPVAWGNHVTVTPAPRGWSSTPTPAP